MGLFQFCCHLRGLWEIWDLGFFADLGFGSAERGSVNLGVFLVRERKTWQEVEQVQQKRKSRRRTHPKINFPMFPTALPVLPHGVSLCFNFFFLLFSIFSKLFFWLLLIRSFGFLLATCSESVVSTMITYCTKLCWEALGSDSSHFFGWLFRIFSVL